jgi:hypothetical protein
MPTGRFAIIDIFPGVFAAVVVALDRFNDTVAKARRWPTLQFVMGRFPDDGALNRYESEDSGASHKMVRDVGNSSRNFNTIFSK